MNWSGFVTTPILCYRGIFWTIFLQKPSMPNTIWLCEKLNWRAERSLGADAGCSHKKYYGIGSRSSQHYSVERSLAADLSSYGLDDDALSHRFHIYEAQLTLLGPNHLRTAKTAMHVACVLAGLSRWEEAIPCWECAYEH